MEIETKDAWTSIRRDTKMIARTLISEYGGKTVSKSGIRYKFNLPYVRSCNIFKLLIMEYDFIESHRTNLIVPLGAKGVNDQ